MTSATGKPMSYFFKEFAVSMFLFLLIAFAVLCCLLGLATVFANQVKAAEVGECKIWQVKNVSGEYDDGVRYTGVRVIAETKTQQAIERLATAKFINFEIYKKTSFDFVEVLLFGEGTAPNERDLTKETAVAGVTYVPGRYKIREKFESHLFGFYSKTLTSKELTEANGDFGNPTTDKTDVKDYYLMALKPKGSCLLPDAALTGDDYQSPEFKPYVSPLLQRN